MKIFFKNKSALSITELVVSTFILLLISSSIFYFITDIYKNIVTPIQYEDIVKISKIQDDLNNIKNNWYFPDAFLEDRYIRFSNPDKDNNYLILYEAWKFWIIYWDFKGSNLQNLIFPENLDYINTDFFSLNEIQNTWWNIYKIDIKLKKDEKTYSLYI